MIKIYLRLVFLLFTTIFSTLSYGQKIFTKSYLVLASNDTLQGFIQEQPSYSRNSTINFKKGDINTEELSYPIAEIVSFHLFDDNETYIIRDVEIDKKPTETTRLEIGMARKIEKQKVILKVLVSGKADLYYYVDENAKEHFFFNNKEGKVTELSYMRFISKAGKALELAEYKQQMRTLFSDCEKMSKRNYSYSLTSIRKSFKNYNICTQSLSYSPEKRKLRIVPMIQAGLAFNHLDHVGADNFNGFTGDYASKWKYTPKQNMMMGIAFNFEPQKLSNPFSMNVALDWRNAGAFTATNGVTDQFSKRKDYSIALSYLSLSVAAKYTFAKNSYLKPFIKFGIGFSYMLSNESSMTSTVFGKSTVSKPLLDLSNEGYGFVSSLGCSVNRFQLEMGYNMTQFSAKSIQAMLYIGAPSIIVSYKFAK